MSLTEQALTRISPGWRDEATGLISGPPPSPDLEVQYEECDLTELRSLLSRGRDLLARKKEIEEEIKLIWATIQDRMGDAQVGTIDGQPAVTWKTHARTYLDSTRLKRELPDVWSEFGTTSQVRRFEVHS